MFRKTVFIIGFFYSLPFGQQVHETHITLDSIVVTAARSSLFNLPEITDVREMPIASVSSIESFFANTPGIFAKSRYNLSQGDKISFRGIGSRAQFGIRGIKIYMDGIPLTFPDGQSQLNGLDPNQIGKIEYLKGPSAIEFTNSCGGVLSFSSIDLGWSKHAKFNGYYGSYGAMKMLAVVGWNFDNSTLVGSFTMFRQRGFRENSAAKVYTFSINGKTIINSKLNLSLAVNLYNAPYLMNPGSLTKDDALNKPAFTRPFVKQQGSGKKLSQFFGGIRLNYQFDESNVFNTVLYGGIRNMFNPIPGRIISLERLSGGIRSELLRQTGIAEFPTNFLLGFEFEKQDDTREEFENLGLYKSYDNYDDFVQMLDEVQKGSLLLNQSEVLNHAAAFFKSETKLSKEINFITGFRFENFLFKTLDSYNSDTSFTDSRRNISSLNFLAGIKFWALENLEFFSSVSSSVQIPTFNELSNVPGIFGGMNYDLLPERITNFEISASSTFSELSFSSSIYYFIINNLILPYQLDSQASDELFYKNAGSAKNLGFEVQMQWNASYYLTFFSSYSNMSYKFSDYLFRKEINGTMVEKNLKGNFVPGVPQQSFASFVLIKYPQNFTTKISFNYFGNYYANDFNVSEPFDYSNASEFIADAYGLTDLFFTYKFESQNVGIVLSFGVNNIFNNSYISSVVPNSAGKRYFEPGIGRNFISELSVEL